MAAGLCLLLARPVAMFAAAFMALRHVLAAVHPTVAVGVGAAAALHVVAVMLSRLVLTRLVLPVMVRRSTLVLVVLASLLLVALMPRLGGLGCGGDGEDERHRGNENLH